MLSAAVVGLAGTHGHSEELMLWLLNLRGPEPEHMQADPSLQHLAGADRALTREPASMSSPLAGKEREGEEAFAPGQLFVAKLRLAFKLMGIRWCRRWRWWQIVRRDLEVLISNLGFQGLQH